MGKRNFSLIAVLNIACIREGKITFEPVEVLRHKEKFTRTQGQREKARQITLKKHKSAEKRYKRKNPNKERKSSKQKDLHLLNFDVVKLIEQ